MSAPLIMPIDDPAAPETARRFVAAGHVCAFPTDTVYGLGVDAMQRDAVARLYALKARPREKALPVLLADEDAWPAVAASASRAARRLMEAFWPGALTIVLTRHVDPEDSDTDQGSTIALRVPDYPALRRVLAATGPLASSSANRSGQPALSSARAVLEALGSGLALLLDGGTLPPRPASTVVDATGPEPVILREGAISADDIRRVVAE